MEQQWKMEGGGSLSLKEDGLRVRLEASRPEDGLGLYKAWVLGERGRFLLGTLAPEDGCLKVRRTVSRQSLMEAGCWPVVGGRCALTWTFVQPQGGEGTGWQLELHPERLCRDPLLQESLRGRVDLWIRKSETKTLLSAPFRPREPFPLPLLFCLAQVELREERPWLVWTFDEEGEPIVPVHRTKAKGTY